MVQQIASQPDIFRLAFHHPTSLWANSHVDIDDKGHFSISFFLFLFGGRKCWKRFDAVLLHLFLLYVCFPFSVERGGTCATGLSIGCKIAIEFFLKIWPVCRQEGRVSRQVYLFHPAKGGKVIVFLFSLETFPEEEDEEEEEPSGHI